MEIHSLARASIFERGGTHSLKRMNKDSDKNVKAVVFDFGGVIELYGEGDFRREIADCLGVSYQDFLTTYFQHNHLANVKNFTWENMILKVVSVFNKGKEVGIEDRDFQQLKFHTTRTVEGVRLIEAGQCHRYFRRNWVSKTAQRG